MNPLERFEKICRKSGPTAQLVSALKDAGATLAAIRAASIGDEWADSAEHFHDICGDTLKHIAAALTQAMEPDDTLTGCADDQTWAGVSAEDFRAVAERALFHELIERGLDQDAADQAAQAMAATLTGRAQ